jgi:hypothetical protein
MAPPEFVGQMLPLTCINAALHEWLSLFFLR